jgi:glycine/D-amino acid oxidase-like deaminating enzyme
VHVEKGTHMSLKVKVDAIIIGAGIMGTSCAFQLSERGLRVAILEAQSSPAMGSTGRSAAGVRVQFTEEVNIRLSWLLSAVCGNLLLFMRARAIRVLTVALLLFEQAGQRTV